MKAQREKEINKMIIDNIFYNTENPLGNRTIIPKQAGLYLVGNVILNPVTEETFYLIKIGMSTNLYNRMKDYSTSNPMMFHIDYKIIEDDADYSKMNRYKRTALIGKKVKFIEEEYHRAMEKLNFTHFEYAQEWFIVSKEVYLEICTKKFNFFTI
jgi:hypothetical protein